MRIAGGVPKVRQSDRGPQFIANFWKYLWKALGTKVALSAPYHPESNSLIERQKAVFIESLRAYVSALQDDWDDHHLVPYEFAYNASVNPSTGESPFFLNHGRNPNLPVARLHPTPSPAVDDFVLQLQNRITAARDHIRMTQGLNADRRAHKLNPVTPQVGDLVLLNTEHYNLMLPSQKLAPKWVGPLRVEEVRGPNTVRVQVPLASHESSLSKTWLTSSYMCLGHQTSAQPMSLTDLCSWTEKKSMKSRKSPHTEVVVAERSTWSTLGFMRARGR